MSAADTIERLLRLASNPAAAPNEARNALAAAEKLRKREPSSAPPPPTPPPPGRVEQRGGVECWVGNPPKHGPVCSQGYGGCAECQAIARWRRWLNVPGAAA